MPTPLLIPGDYQYQALQRGPRLQRFWHRNKAQVLRLTLPLAPGGLVVDVGCGSANLTVESGRVAHLAIGLDPSAAAVRFGSERADAPRCRFGQANGEALPLPDGCADGVLLVEVIEHLAAPAATLVEISRILKSTGYLFLTTPNYAFPSLWPLWEWLADHSGLTPAMEGVQHIQKFSTATLRALLQQCGFVVERLGTFYGLSPFLALLSETRADAAVRAEVDRDPRGGALIYCVAKRAFR